MEDAVALPNVSLHQVSVLGTVLVQVCNCERADLVVSRARFFVSTGAAYRNVLNTRKSNFAMRVNFITRTFHAAALARKHCTSIYISGAFVYVYMYICSGCMY